MEKLSASTACASPFVALARWSTCDSSAFHYERMCSFPAFRFLPVKLPSSFGNRRRCAISCSALRGTTSRRGLFHSAAAIVAATSFSIDPFRDFAALAASTKPNSGNLESAVVPVVMCRTVLNPVRRYIEEGEWDKSRTNINYCTRVLALKKNIRKSAEFLEGDAFYDLLNIAGDLDNILTQLDATVYTPLFIPSDEGVSVEQRKYQNQAFSYYDIAIEYLDSFFTKIPGEELEKARQTAKGRSYEIVVEAK